MWCAHADNVQQVEEFKEIFAMVDKDCGGKFNWSCYVYVCRDRERRGWIQRRRRKQKKLINGTCSVLSATILLLLQSA